ncbi:MGMT family protein [Natronobiforma cellulositropha]|uniref:MGMT family protein n=1 Tax=Natronobiforma cellulositropha TaxID=1679076 RepID=UPI0021D59E86|nr:MGMT family protein [Natronobiforma cellulositropha]
MDDDPESGIYARESPYLERFVQIGVASGRLLRVSFPEHPDENARADHPLLERLFEYLAGVEEVGFEEVEVALTMATDQRAVLESLRTVPYGEQVDVTTLTRMTAGLDPADDEDIVLVRTALAENPLPIVIPDHRVRDGPSAAPPPVEQKLRSLEGL